MSEPQPTTISLLTSCSHQAIGSCLLKLAILFVVAKYMSLAVPPLLVVCFLLQKCYLRTSRQIRLLSIEAKAPLFQHLSEALSGGASIRAFKWQTYLEEANLSMVDTSQKCTYTLFMVQQWLRCCLCIRQTFFDQEVGATHETLVEVSVGEELERLSNFS